MGAMKDLFGDKPVEFGDPTARATDPVTSHQAAMRAKINVGTNRWNCLVAHYCHPAGLTDYELGDRTGLQQNSAGKRRGELMAAGLIEETALRRLSPTQSPCIVWKITRAGVAFVMQKNMQKSP